MSVSSIASPANFQAPTQAAQTVAHRKHHGQQPSMMSDVGSQSSNLPSSIGSSAKIGSQVDITA
jgi:hypothetical protein